MLLALGEAGTNDVVTPKGTEQPESLKRDSQFISEKNVSINKGGILQYIKTASITALAISFLCSRIVPTYVGRPHQVVGAVPRRG